MTMSMGMPEMPGVLNELGLKDKKRLIGTHGELMLGYNMYTSTINLRDRTPTDEETMQLMAIKPGYLEL